MSTSSRQREAEQVTQAYQLALSRIGVGTVAEAIILWESLSVTAQKEQAQTWLDQAVQLVLTRRDLSVQLARAYYRLLRALITGTTIEDPNHPDPGQVTLGDLRYEFELLTGPEGDDLASTGNDIAKARNAAQEPAQARENDPAATPAPTSRSQRPKLPDDDHKIPTEKVDTTAEEAAAHKAAANEARLVLVTLGPVNQSRKASEIDTTKPADDVDKERQKIHDKAGAQQAAAASRIAMNGARSTSWALQEKDHRALGWARVSTTGTPCGWCAMLISRGPVYRSEQSANYKGTFGYVDGDKYHDNCYCVAIPIFTRDFYGSSPLFALNRRYSELWPQVTSGLGGKSALSAWRRFIRTSGT